MVHYKLTYFNGRGLAEVTRQLFALADQKYEDVRHTDQTFAKVKSTFPFEQLPALEVDGQVLAQSHAIARYVARTFGFAGKDAFEQAVIDSLADQYKDYYNEIWPYLYVVYGIGPGDAAKLKDEVLLPGRAKFLGLITNFLKKNSTHGRMVQYKLTYFNGRGLAEVTRQLFVLADQKYEDVRHTNETFSPVKSTFPFGQLPVLEVDGQVLAQSYAIARYVARTFGFAGKDAFEQAVIDSLADQYKDYKNEIWPYIQVVYGFGTGDATKLKDEVLLPGRAKFLGFITNFLKKNAAHGYLVGDKISWVDLLIAEHTSDMSRNAPEYFDGFPEVKAHMELIRQNPKIKKWLESRPETVF